MLYGQIIQLLSFLQGKSITWANKGALQCQEYKDQREQSCHHPPEVNQTFQRNIILQLFQEIWKV